jgi:hypothetical protein
MRRLRWNFVVDKRQGHGRSGLVCSLESNGSQPQEVESALLQNLNSASHSHDKGTVVPSFFKITSK